MWSCLAWCYLIVATCSVLPAVPNRLDAEGDQNHNILHTKVSAATRELFRHRGISDTIQTNYMYHGTSMRKRMKRGFISAGAAALKGLRAMMRLLLGARKIPSENGFVREYVKKGDYKQTLKDFYSVKPFDVQHSKLPNGADVVIGKVGDRTLMAQSFGESGRPSLSTSKTKIVETLSPRKLSKSGIDRVIYVD